MLSSTYGVYFIYVDDPSVAYNTITSADHASTLYGIFYSSGIAGNVVGSNNAFTLSNISSASATQYIYSSNSVTSNTFNNNTFAAAGTVSSNRHICISYTLQVVTPNR
ncbi:MAG: hypothetical protein U5J96_07670 [Ignavibacteriaceae bacterium]|nr:hypothetical protein [Ignavibacteriaceae bacterium]